MLSNVLTNKLPQLIQLLKAHRVKRAYAFGSVCTNKFNEDSDIDILIAFEEGMNPVQYSTIYFDLVEKLEHLLQRPIDLVTEYSLKNPYFIKTINKTKVPIYES
jgi:uncharacterized protein